MVTTFHYLRPVDLRTSLLRLFFLVPAVASHGLIVTTDWEAAYARRIFPWKRVAVAPAGPTFVMIRSSDAERRQTRQRMGLDEGDYVVAFFGFLLPNKGLEPLLGAAGRLPDTVKLLIIGGTYQGDDPYTAQLRRRASELGLDHRILWTGHVGEGEAARLLSAADCAALPFEEGASFKRSTLLAAFQLSLPVVTTLGPETHPSMRDGDNLVLVPAQDPAALAAAIARLQSNPDMSQELGRRGHELCDLVSWQSIVGRHLELYTAVAAHRQGIRTH